MDDAALFAALSRGERDALEMLYDRHAPPLYAIALRLVRERLRAEDLLHDTFLALARHARTGAACPSVLRWLAERLVSLSRAPQP